MREMVQILNSDIEDIRPINQNKINYIISCPKESEKSTDNPEQSNEHIENVENITSNSDSLIPKEKQDVSDKYHQAISYNKHKANKSVLGNREQKH